MRLKTDYISMSVFLFDVPRVVNIILKLQRKTLYDNLTIIIMVLF